MTKLTDEQIGLLRLVATYGDGLDLRGPRIAAKVRRAGLELIASRHLSGNIHNLSLTPAGRAALSPDSGEEKS